MTANVRRLLLVLSMLALVITGGRAVGLFLPGLSHKGDGSVTESSTQPRTHAAEVSGSWYEGANGYTQADSQHRDSRVALIVYFYADWCPYCKKLDRDVLPSVEVSDFMKSVIKVRINPEKGPDELALARRFGVHGYPSLFVVSSETELPRKIYPFRRVGETFQALEPTEFVNACRVAGAP